MAQMPRRWRTFTWRHGFAFVVACTALMSGCTGSDAESDEKEQGGVTVTRAENATPVETVLRLWREIDGGSPTLVYEYDPRVLRLLGTDRMLAAYDQAPPIFAGTPRVTHVEKVRLGTQVTVRARPPGEKQPRRAVFLLGKVRDRWLVRYDSNLVTATRARVTEEVKQRLAPRAATPPRRATDAGARAARQLRGLFAQGPKRGTLATQ